MSIQFQHHQLANGLTIIAECNERAHTGGVAFFVNTGTRDELLPVMGVSHFLEHMMFKGTSRRSADDVNREFDEIGANYNAYTSHEKTVYYAQVLPEFIGRAVDLLGDMMRPALREDDFAMEKNVILEEISMYDDRPQWRLQDQLLETYFASHPLGYRVLGTTDSIKALTATQMREYFDRRYSPDNMVVAAAGKIDFLKLVEQLETLAGHWSATGTKRQHGDPVPHFKNQRMADTKLTRHYVQIMAPGPSAQDEKRYAAAILADLIGDSEGSHLYWALVDPGLADEADLSHMAQDQVGAFLAYASCDPKRAEQVEQMLLKTIMSAVDQIQDDEVQRTQNKLATQATLQGERPSGRMLALGSQWAMLGEYMSLAKEVEKLTAVTTAEVKEVAKEFSFKQHTVIRMGPTV